MSERLLNLVGTRIPAGDHDNALRWYADHVHQLMAFPGLHEAALYRRAAAGSGESPQWLALYDFGTQDSFEAYGASELYAEVQRDRMAGWGRDGIDIVLRKAFHRVVRQQRGGARPRHWQVRAWREPPSAAAERAWAARCFELHADAQVLLRAAVPGAGDADYVSLVSAHSAQVVPQPEALWAADYDLEMEWTR